MAQLIASDGAALAYDAYEPERMPPKAALLWLCGWSDHRTRWRAAAERLCAAGYAVYVLDQRGHGDSAGLRGHLSRFSQLVGDLQGFRRLARLRSDAPHVLLGHSFGALVVLRYLETQPSDPVRAAVLSAPWFQTVQRVPRVKLLVAKLLADLWPTLRIATGTRGADLCRDPAVGAAFNADPAVHHVMTPGAWREIQWAQRAVPADRLRIDCPLLFLLAGQDRITDASSANAFADGVRVEALVHWYPEMFHEILLESNAVVALDHIVDFLATRGL